MIVERECAMCDGTGEVDAYGEVESTYCGDCGGSGLVPQPPDMPETDESRFAQRMRERRRKEPK